MKQKITVIASLTIASLLFSVYQPGDAVTYYGHDGSIDEYMTKKTVKPYAGKSNLWTYIVEICATDRNLSIATVTLKSDMDERQSSGFKTIKHGECTIVGAVMKAKDSSTLGATMLEKHEAIQRMQELIDGDNKNMSQKEKSEMSRLQSVTGVYLR